MKKNIDQATVESFGEEWTRFDQSNLSIEEAKKIHGDKYDYLKVDYKNVCEKVIIICKEHGDFEQIPDFHINRKCKCPKCAKNVSTNVEEFITKSNLVNKNKNNYNYYIA